MASQGRGGRSGRSKELWTVRQDVPLMMWAMLQGLQKQKPKHKRKYEHSRELPRLQ